MLEYGKLKTYTDLMRMDKNKESPLEYVLHVLYNHIVRR